MAANTSPAPKQESDPESEAPPAVTAEPEKSKPVVLATLPLEELLMPAGLDAEGNPKGDDLLITSAGVALSKADAGRVQEAAKRSNVTLIEKKDES